MTQSNSQNGWLIQISKDYSTEYKLFEVDENMIRLIEEEKVCLKGTPNDEAILCTPNDTFSVRMAESSNTFFFMETIKEDHKGNLNILGSSSHYLEISKVMPRLHTIKNLLSKNYFSGEKNDNNSGYSFQQLSKIVQASDEEIHKGLADLHAFEHKGKWRILEPSYEEEILEFILTEIASHEWDLDNISQKECVDALTESSFDPVGIVQCLSKYSTSHKQINGDTIFNIDFKAVCIFRAIQLLRLSKSWTVDSFFAEWTNTLPDRDEKATFDMLKGIALVNTETSPTSIELFLASSLSPDTRSRLRELFQKRNNWKLDALEPYIKDLVPPGTTTEQFLLKFARARQTPNGPLWSMSYIG